MDRWLQSFRAELDATGLLAGVSRLIVAVSGGPDSVALLTLLDEWTRVANQPPELLVGHVHHGIRGREADGDAEFVARLAAERGLELLCSRLDAPALSSSGMSMEAAARLARYGAFREWARARGADGIALGHHADDQAETVLLRAVRGSGLRGLGGMPRSRSLEDEMDPRDGRGAAPVRVVRPLLGWRREEIQAFLAERGQDAREDSTNADAAIPRNRIRAEILPALEATQPGATASLARLGELARRARADLRALGERAYRESRTDDHAGRVGFDADALATWPASVLYEVIDEAMRRAEAGRSASPDRGARARAGESTSVLAARPFERLMLELARWVEAGKIGGSVIQLGRGLEAELRYGRVTVRARPASAGESAEPALVGRAVGDGAEAHWEGWDFSFTRYELPPGAVADLRDAPARATVGDGSWIERFDLDVLDSTGPLHVRARRDGDVFHPLGAPGRKKLKEFFRECEVEPHRRRSVPLLASGETIQWVVGYRMGHLARCRPETRRVLEVRADRGEGRTG